MSSGPYEVKPRQLRALVLLLMCLPLVPTAFVVRFMIEAIYYEHLDARERARPVYQKFLESAGATLAATTARQIPSDAAGRLDDVWPDLVESGAIDAALSVAPDGRLLALPDPPPPDGAKSRMVRAQTLAHAMVENGLRQTVLSTRGAVRWRFLSETPEPVFALSPRPAPGVNPPAPGALFLKTRQHLLEMLSNYYQRTLDPQSTLRLLDENGESVPLVGASDTATGEPLVDLPLRAPLPAWRVQLFNSGAPMADGLVRDQIVFYFWTIGGVLAVTGAIVAVAGFALTRRIVLQELSNDALAVVSHEMKTPLASIRMFVDTLLERRGPANAQHTDEYLRLIAQENSRLERLVEGFLTLSRLERARDRPPALSPTDAGEIAESAAARLRPRLEAGGCEFHLEIAPNLPFFAADAEGMTTVLVNLLDNALKYSGEQKRIELRAFARNGSVVFEVRDDGPGIARDEQEKIFQRFYQSDRRLARSHDGCGLGLSIVESIVRAHGGEVAVESAPGRGSIFRVILPKA